MIRGMFYVSGGVEVGFWGEGRIGFVRKLWDGF